MGYLSKWLILLYLRRVTEAYTYNVATALKNKFGYTSATAITPFTDLNELIPYPIHIPYAADFYPRLQNNMKNRQPAQLDIVTDPPTGGPPTGHSIVCDGYGLGVKSAVDC